MKIEFATAPDGLRARFAGRHYALRYPGRAWEAMPHSAEYTNNLAFLLTMNIPMVSRFRSIEYSTGRPSLLPDFRKLVMNSIPAAVDEYKTSIAKAKKKHMGVKYIFSGASGMSVRRFPQTYGRAVVSFSSGKDSLLTLGLAKELGLGPSIAYINDTVSPFENRTKLKFMEKLSRKIGAKSFVIRNELEKLNDFETWGMPETCLGYTHMVTAFSMTMLPIALHTGSNLILVGNEDDMNRKFRAKDGTMAYPSYDQTKFWTRKMSDMASKMTNGRVGVSSLIEPLSGLAITKVLHDRYPEIARYQFSCGCTDVSGKRWCHGCSTCASMFLYLKALGKDPKKFGFRRNMLEKKYMKFFTLFNGRKLEPLEKVKGSEDDDMLAFYHAMKNGAKGGLIDMFRERHLQDFMGSKDAIRKEAIGLTKCSSVRGNIRGRLLSILREELTDSFK